MSEPMTAIFFSCRRLALLNRAVKAFIEINTYPVQNFIIVNDSGDRKIHADIEKTYQDAAFVFNEHNEGLIKSIDIGYSYIKTEYFFHTEDDWMITKKGFLEQSLEIMLSDPKIEEVWLADYNNHPLEKTMLKIGNVNYRLAAENYQRGNNGYNNFAWHGFATACGLKRMSDYKKVAPYSVIPWEGTVWHREQAIGERYHQLGYRTAVLIGEYARNIGYGRSEYKSGYEK